MFFVNPKTIEDGIGKASKFINKYISHTTKYELPLQRMDTIITKNPKSKVAEFLKNIITLTDRVHCYHIYLKEIRVLNNRRFEQNRRVYRELIEYLDRNLHALLETLETATNSLDDIYITSLIEFVYPIFEIFQSTDINAPQPINLPPDRKRKETCQSSSTCTEDQIKNTPSTGDAFRKFDCVKKKTKECLFSKYNVPLKCYYDRFDLNLKYNNVKGQNEWYHVSYPGLIQQSLLRFETLIQEMLKDRRQKINRGQHINSDTQSLKRLRETYLKLKSFLIGHYIDDQQHRAQVQKNFNEFLDNNLIQYPASHPQQRVHVQTAIFPTEVKTQRIQQHQIAATGRQVAQQLKASFQQLRSQTDRKQIQKNLIAVATMFSGVDPEVLSRILTQSPDTVKHNVNVIRAVRQVVRKIPDAQKRKALIALLPDDKAILRAALEDIRASGVIDPVLAWASTISIPAFKSLLSEIREQDKDLFRDKNVIGFVDRWISETSQKAQQRQSLHRQMTRFRIGLIPPKGQQAVTQGIGVDAVKISQKAVRSLIDKAKQETDPATMFLLLKDALDKLVNKTLPEATRRRIQQSIIAVPKENIDRLVDLRKTQKAMQIAKRYDEIVKSSVFPKYVPYVKFKLQGIQSRAVFDKTLAGIRRGVTGGQQQKYEEEESYQDDQLFL